MYDIFCTTPLHKKAFKWQLLFRQVRFIISDSSTELPTLIQCAFFLILIPFHTFCIAFINNGSFIVNKFSGNSSFPPHTVFIVTDFGIEEIAMNYMLEQSYDVSSFSAHSKFVC